MRQGRAQPPLVYRSGRIIRRRHTRGGLLAVFVVGSVVTLGLAWLLFHRRHPLAAVTVLEVSPFPCPPGLPC